MKLRYVNKIKNMVQSVMYSKKKRMSVTTTFFRNMVQLRTILELMPTPRRINVFACSKGCEAYSLAILYHHKNSGHIPEINGYDINEECINVAKKGIYTRDELNYNGKRSDEAEIQEYFKHYFVPHSNGSYTIREDIQSSCRFSVGSLLNTAFVKTLAPADIVVCQNMLIHLNTTKNKLAIMNLMQNICSGGLLVIGGMNLRLREKLLPQMNCSPVVNNCKEIHEGQIDLRLIWDKTSVFNRPYFAMPPFEKTTNWECRYSTLFKDDTTAKKEC